MARPRLVCTDPSHDVRPRKSGGRICRTCATEYHRKYREEHREHIRSRANERQRTARASTPAWIRYLWNKWGMTPEEYDVKLAAQGGVCAICKEPPDMKRLCVDHNHDTGAVRGLIHAQCNTAIGMLNDDPELVEAAAIYLRSYRGE